MMSAQIWILPDKITGDVVLGSVSACASNPCVFGKCVEKWRDYFCVCEDTFSISGKNCEKNLNLDALTMLERSLMMEWDYDNVKNAS